jgi:hypothetical protein
MCVFQHWTAGFNPNAERSTAGKGGSTASPKIPTWITLRQILDEFLGVCHQIAAGIGEILGTNKANGRAEDPKFCVALDSGAGWEPSVVVTNSITQTKATILIDYNFLPIRCRYCFSTEHCIKDCPARSEGRKQRSSQGQLREQRHGTGGRSQSTRQQGAQPRQQQQPVVNSRISRADKGKQIEIKGKGEAQSPASNSKQLADKDGFQVYISPRNRRSGKSLQRWDVNAHGVHTPASEVKQHGEPSNNLPRNQEIRGSAGTPEAWREPSPQRMTQATMVKAVQPEEGSKSHNLEDLNLPHSRLGSPTTQVGMAWSPTNVSGKKRMGCIMSLSESDPEGEHGSQEYARRGNDQDLNVAPGEGLAQEELPLILAPSQERRERMTRAIEGLTSSPECTQDLFSPNEVQATQDSQDTSTPSQNWGPVGPTTSSMSVELCTPPGRREEQGNGLPELDLTEEEEELIVGMQDPPPQQWWQIRDAEGMHGPYSAPTRLADRLGRKKLTNIRSRVAPYSSGVFRSRMEIDLRAPADSYGGLKVIQICNSPTSPRSGASLPFP